MGLGRVQDPSPSLHTKQTYIHIHANRQHMHKYTFKDKKTTRLYADTAFVKSREIQLLAAIAL